MNILLLTNFFSPEKGGGEYLFVLMAKLLAKNGHRVWVITNKLQHSDYPIHENIKIIFVSNPRRFEGGMPVNLTDKIRYSFSALKEGLRLIKKEKIDIIHSNPFAPTLSGSMISFLTSTPHIIVVHDVFSRQKDFWKEWSKQKGISSLDRFLGPFFEKIIIKLKHASIHTVSEATKQDLIEFGAKKSIYVIPNAIPIKPVEDVKTIPFQFVYLGNLLFYKNLDVVIKSIKIVKKTHPKITLTIIGDGPYRTNLEKLVTQLDLKENIIFKGHVTDLNKMKLLSSCQGLVFPSTCEGFGIVILEAFFQKKPVIVSDVKPLSDIVENKKTGLVIDPHNKEQWAEALEKILIDPHFGKQMGENGRKILEKKYNLEILWQNIFKMYTDHIKPKNPT